MISRLLALAGETGFRIDPWPTRASSCLKWLLGAFVLIGLLARLSPLTDLDGRLFWQYMTEDGYLMQIVARNMAIGLGMSTAEGTLPTNGVQPLATFVFAVLHFLAGGSKAGGIALVTLFSAFVSVAAAYFLYKVADRVLAHLPQRRGLANFIAVTWLAAPKIIDHSMNGLETGIYYLAILITLHYYLQVTSDEFRPLPWRQRILLGILLGITFLARNDAVFYIAALLFVHLAMGGGTAGGGYRRRFADCMIAGTTSVLVGTPWLVNNYFRFGSVVPVSGISESHGIRLGQNLPHIPANLFESTFLFAPVPESMEKMALVIAISSFAVVASATGYWLSSGRLTLSTRRFALFAILFTAGIVIYYGVFFGVAFFVPRYLSPLSPFWWLATCVTAYVLLSLLFNGSRFHYVTLTLTVMLVLCSTLFAWSDFSAGRTHMHKQVVDWVRENVPPAQWVGAVQTGTLGFFHDRTINLDGKVNPEAMRARVQEGHVLNYVVDSKIDYLADWSAIADWPQRKGSPRFSQAFETVLKDDKLNLGVVRRRQPVNTSQGR